MQKLLLILSLVLSGCASNDIRPTVLPGLTAKEVRVNQVLLQPCEQLVPLPIKASTEEVILIIKNNYDIYYKCKLKNESLIEVINKFANKEPIIVSKD